MGWERLLHPQYLPDVASMDVQLFRSLEHFLGGKRFANLNENVISIYFAQKSINFYQSTIENLHTIRWQKVVDNYIKFICVNLMYENNTIFRSPYNVTTLFSMPLSYRKSKFFVWPTTNCGSNFVVLKVTQHENV